MSDWKEEVNQQLYVGNDPYIFISYNHSDAQQHAFFQKLLERLHQDGYRFWFDNHISPGANWCNTLIDRVMRCRILVALLSNRYFESKWCITELYTAINENKALIPLECESITTADNRGYQNMISACYQIVPGTQMERLFNVDRIADCLENDADREKRLKEIDAIPVEEKPAEQKIIAESPSEAISKEIVKRNIEQMFETKNIPVKPTAMAKRHFYSKPEAVFTPAEIDEIMKRVLELLREQHNKLHTVLYSLTFTGSRNTYKEALTTVKLVERLTKYYDFWTYHQNQKLHYFISDSAPLLRLMRCRAVRNEPLLSPVMIAAVKNFTAELDRLIDCLDG